MHSEKSTNDVLSGGSGFKVHGVQVRYLHLTVESSEELHSCIFGCCIERAGALVSIHDQNIRCCQNERVSVKMSQTQDEEKSDLVRSYNLLSFRTAGCVT